jgi:hypothetical protein
MPIQSFYCKCGTTLECEYATARGLERATSIFWQVHKGPGHGECDGETCRAARTSIDIVAPKRSGGPT